MAWIWLYGTNEQYEPTTNKGRQDKWAQVETIRGGADADDGGKKNRGRK